MLPGKPRILTINAGSSSIKFALFEVGDSLRRIEEILLTEAFHRRFPDLPQVACFDTAFHHDLARVAQILPIPRRYEAQGV